MNCIIKYQFHTNKCDIFGCKPMNALEPVVQTVSSKKISPSYLFKEYETPESSEWLQIDFSWLRHNLKHSEPSKDPNENRKGLVYEVFGDSIFILQSLTTSNMRKCQTIKLSQLDHETTNYLKTCWTVNLLA